jgi:hypothetical protein
MTIVVYGHIKCSRVELLNATLVNFICYYYFSFGKEILAE